MAAAHDSISQGARDAMRRSESRYRRLFETARDGILLLNADTAQIEDVNPYLVELLGYSHEELLGKAPPAACCLRELPGWERASSTR